MPNDLTGQFIANTFQNLIQKPDINKEEYYNGLGATISVINRDAIGTIKMFYPIGGTISSYFDNSGLGLNDWEGWALCDGNNSTPNLQNRFVVGVGNLYTIGATGGNNTTVLTMDNIPPHNHEITVSKWGVASSSDGVKWADQGQEDHDEQKSTSTVGGVVGSAQGFENRPPYIALYYVIRIN